MKTVKTTTQEGRKIIQSQQDYKYSQVLKMFCFRKSLIFREIYENEIIFIMRVCLES